MSKLRSIVSSSIRAIACALIVFLSATNVYAEDFTAVELPSDEREFLVSMRSKLDPIIINQIHQWELTVKNIDGAPIKNAEISISGGMQAHNHGLPTAPRVTEELRPGVYLVEGMKFQMGGSWVVNFKITAAEKTDSITFELTL